MLGLVWFGFVGFYGMPTFVGNFMPNPVIYIYIYISGDGWLWNQGMQSTMQANFQGEEGKGEPFPVPPNNYLPISTCDCDVN